jgi:hypothetical protein
MVRMLKGLVLTLALVAGAAQAAEVAGVKFEPRAKVGAAELVLNGAGVRTRAFFKVYAIGLYLPEKQTNPEGVLAVKGGKRLHLVTLRDLTAQQLADALIEQLQKNHTEAELAALKPAIDEFRATLLALNAAPSGTVVLIDYLPDSGTRLTVAGQPRGKPIPGEEFSRALLRIWLGDKPAQTDLKDALLGKAG